MSRSNTTSITRSPPKPSTSQVGPLRLRERQKPTQLHLKPFLLSSDRKHESLYSIPPFTPVPPSALSSRFSNDTEFSFTCNQSSGQDKENTSWNHPSFEYDSKVSLHVAERFVFTGVTNTASTTTANANGGDLRNQMTPPPTPAPKHCVPSHIQMHQSSPPPPTLQKGTEPLNVKKRKRPVNSEAENVLRVDSLSELPLMESSARAVKARRKKICLSRSGCVEKPLPDLPTTRLSMSTGKPPPDPKPIPTTAPPDIPHLQSQLQPQPQPQLTTDEPQPLTPNSFLDMVSTTSSTGRRSLHVHYYKKMYELARKENVELRKLNAQLLQAEFDDDPEPDLDEAVP